MKIKFLLVSAVLVMFSLAGCAQKKTVPTASVEPDTTSIGKAEITTNAIKREDKYAEYDYKQPVVKLSGKYASNAEALNSLISKDFEKVRAESEKDAKDFGEQEDPSLGSKFKFSTVYKVGYNKDGLISIAIQYFSFTGGAHGMVNSVFYNYDLKNNRVIPINELFKKSVDYKSIVREEIKKQIDAEGGYNPDAMDIVSDSLDHLNFYFTEEGVMIYYSPYELAAYSKGEIFFLITKDLSYKGLDLGFIKGDDSKSSSDSSKKPAPEISDEDIIEAVKMESKVTNEIIRDGMQHIYNVDGRDYGKLVKYDSMEKIEAAYEKYCVPGYSNKIAGDLQIGKRGGFLSIPVGDGTAPNFSSSKVVKREVAGSSLLVTITEEFMGEEERMTYIFNRDENDGGRYKIQSFKASNQ